MVKEDPKDALKNDEVTVIEEEGNERPVGKGPDSPKSLRRELWKLHNQMCHVTVRRTKAKLEREGVWRPEMEGVLTERDTKNKIDDSKPRVGGQGGWRSAASSPKAKTTEDREEVRRCEDSTRTGKEGEKGHEKEAKVATQGKGKQNEKEPLFAIDEEAS